MKSISKFILEKFKINSKTVSKDSKSHVFTDEELKDPKTYDTCDIPELDEQIDDKIKELIDENPGFPYKKRKNNKGINTNWYRFYCYLYYNGPSKKEDCVKGVKGDTNSQYAQIFTDMKWRHILLNEKRGLWEIGEPKNWTI